MQFVFSKANADAGGRKINEMIDAFVAEHDNCAAFASLGIRRYVNLLRFSEGMIGNSSSGIIEAPAIGIPTVNIGNRQKGRLQAASILNCVPEKNEIIQAVRKSQTKEFKEQARNTENPYGDGNVSEKIVQTITEYLYEDRICLEKKFYDVAFNVL